MIQIFTVLFDTDGDRDKTPTYSFNLYSAAWVDKMYRMLMRNTTVPFELYCITHYPQDCFKEPVAVLPFIEDDRSWLQLNEVYFPGNITTDRCAWFALDTVITGNIDHIMAYDGDLGVVDCGGVFANPFTFYSKRTAEHLWTHWRANQKQHMLDYRIGGKPSELRWLEAEVTAHHPDLYNWHYLNKLYGDDQMWSWPIDARDKKQPEYFPPDTRIVYFHGRGKQHNCRASWVKEHWR